MSKLAKLFVGVAFVASLALVLADVAQAQRGRHGGGGYYGGSGYHGGGRHYGGYRGGYRHGYRGGWYGGYGPGITFGFGFGAGAPYYYPGRYYYPRTYYGGPRCERVRVRVWRGDHWSWRRVRRCW